MADDWSRQENEAIVADYLRMLAAEQRGERYSKTAHRAALAPLLNGRSDGSIERKHMNISAALVDLGFPYINGYKPLPNYQAALAKVISDRTVGDTLLHNAVRSLAEAEAIAPAPDDILSRWEQPPPPAKQPVYNPIHERSTRVRPTVNWLEVEARNQSLGRAGEHFVVRFERARLISAGKPELADRVEHVADATDVAGFDVRSYESNGKDRLIEVKTTAHGKFVPFFLSRNEVAVSRTASNSYFLYRLFRFRTDPRLYGLKGSLDETCWLDPVQFSARVK
jgi:uncharacterized protein DUF3883